VFGEPTMTCVPARGRKSVRYVAMLYTLPADFDIVSDIAIEGDGFRVLSETGLSFLIRSTGARRWFDRSAD